MTLAEVEVFGLHAVGFVDATATEYLLVHSQLLEIDLSPKVLAVAQPQRR